MDRDPSMNALQCEKQPKLRTNASMHASASSQPLLRHTFTADHVFKTGTPSDGIGIFSRVDFSMMRLRSFARQFPLYSQRSEKKSTGLGFSSSHSTAVSPSNGLRESSSTRNGSSKTYKSRVPPKELALRSTQMMNAGRYGSASML